MPAPDPDVFRRRGLLVARADDLSLEAGDLESDRPNLNDEVRHNERNE